MIDRAKVLLVEDSRADQHLVFEALSGANWVEDIRAVESADKAFHVLRGDGAHAGSPPPDLIILDLNLPGQDGRSVLRELRADRRLSAIPVIILTSSSRPEDKAVSYALGADRFVTKPDELDAYLAAVRSIETTWSMLVGRRRRQEGKPIATVAPPWVGWQPRGLRYAALIAGLGAALVGLLVYLSWLYRP